VQVHWPESKHQPGTIGGTDDSVAAQSRREVAVGEQVPERWSTFHGVQELHGFHTGGCGSIAAAKWRIAGED